MTSVMLGSHAFQIAAGIAADLLQAEEQQQQQQAPVSCLKPESLCSAICGTAGAACLLLAVLGDTMHWAGLGALLLFEFCSGVYYPAIGTLKVSQAVRQFCFIDTIRLQSEVLDIFLLFAM